jgi:hypothetical protein
MKIPEFRRCATPTYIACDAAAGDRRVLSRTLPIETLRVAAMLLLLGAHSAV